MGCVALAPRKKGRIAMPFRTRIKELRARYDLTQDDLARKVGVRREAILYIEKGNYNPSLKLAHDIAKALQTTINDLFIFEDT
jgi:putative transcriptional regulator